MEKIYVSVRARPLTPDDSKSSLWKIQGNSISLSTNQSTKFDFDRIFMEDSRTADIFEARTKVIVASAVRGFNGTVFAYGQTSSGKTHTMRGNSAEPGIIPLAVYELFATIQEDACREFLVRMSYMEIYNEEINDLLAPEHRKLQIHESLERGIYVAGLKEEIVSSPKQVLDFMEVGESHRHIGQTNMNLYSSRSHTIFRMIIESREKPADGDDDSCDAVRVSILNLVDLAGSERAAKTGAEGMRLKEGSHINKSLMTLGTVIKKLSEGTESQRGHVPYRDSKLTRILQPALGGNANTAIICNITLAQIHTDETKSTLQFASRALQVTNCACVNEILTDGVLLKRQRKEIEELRAKLLSSHSEHLEEEILNLRNTLLQSELEKERIAMELEVEKKDKAYRERRLAEQEKKIENLSSLVLYSERDEKNTNLTKNKRRVTWCPRSLSQKLDNLESTPNEEALNKEYSGDSGDADLLPPFSELMQEHDVIMDDPHSNSCIPGSKDKRVEFSLPDKHALLHVTSRRKVHQGRDEPLLMKTAGTESLESECSGSRTSSCSFMFQVDESAPCALSLTVRESEEIPITMLRELENQVRLVEMEKTATQRNLDDVLELATEQNACFSEICNQESKAFLSTELSNVVQEIALQVDHAKSVMDSVLSFVGDVSQNLFNLSEILLDVRSTSSQNMVQFESIICGHSTIQNYARKKMDEFELEKNLLENQLVDHQKQIQELESNLVNWEKAMEDQHIQHELEKDELLGQVLNLEKELSCSSYPTLAREKDTLRKEVDKTKQKLKDAEAKLKNAIQDKTRLENEKTQAEREVKRLVGQRAILDRDIWRRDSIVDRRQSKSFDCGNAKGSVGIHDQNLQMEYQKLFFEMEAEINSLREALITATTEKEDAYLRNKNLHSELNLMTENFDAANLEIKLLKEEIIKMEENLGKSEFISRDLKVSLDLLSKEKEEMGMQLTDALLEMEIEKSTWLDKEKDLVQSNDRIKLSDDTIASLSKDLSEVRHELESSREQNKLLKENAERERECSVAIRSENAEIRNELEQLEVRRDEYEDLLSARTDAEELVRRLQSEASVFGKEKTKLRMQLRSTQSKLDAFRVKYKEEVEVKRIMDMKFKDASSKYREKLRQLGNEVLDLKNQLVNRKQN